MNKTLYVERLGKTFGATIDGINLATDIDPDTMAQVKNLWSEHQLLLFRNQDLTEEQLVAFSRGLGDLEIHLRREYLSRDNPEILMISNMKDGDRTIGILSDTEVGWHYDQIYLPKPAVGSLLYSVILPNDGGQTSFADMTAAFEALSDDMKAKLGGRKAIQSYEAFNAQFSVPTNKTQKKMSPDIAQPLVRTHPITGRKALYICPGMTTEIVGLEPDDSRETLDFLFDWCVRDEFVYTHDWVLGDALLWDNASTMHRREPFDSSEQRLMKRTTILPPEDIAQPF
jgi:taurine dioxygenase